MADETAPPTAESAGVDLGRIQNDPAFQRLAPDSQQRVLNSLGAQPPELPNASGGTTMNVPTQRTPVQDPNMPIESAVPGELKKALIDPSYRLLTGRSQGVGGTTMDVLSTAQVMGAGAAMIASGPLAAGSVLLAPVAGAAVRGILTDFNASAGWTNFLGGLTEIGVGGYQAMSGYRSMVKGAKALVGEAEAGGAVAEGTESAAAVTAKSNIGRSILDRTNAAIETRATPLRRAIDGLEKTATTLKVHQGDDAFHDVATLVTEAKQMRISTPEIVKLEQSLQRGEVDMNDVVSLRKNLEGNLRYAKSATDPNTPAGTKMARAIRGYATDAISSSLGPEAGSKYGEALVAWKNQVRDPQRILRTVLSKNLEPSTAFEMVYGPQTAPEILQTLSSMRDVDPTFRATLRLGAMQHFFAAAGGDIRQSIGGAKALKNISGLLETTGLFSPEELNSLRLFMKPGMLENAMSNMSNAIQGPVARAGRLGLAIGGYEAASRSGAVYHLMANHPQLALMSIAASGGLPFLRRIAMAPPGSAMAVTAATAVVKGLTQMGSALANRPSAETDD